MTPAPPRAADFENPADVAAHLVDAAAVVVAGPNADAAARVAVAIAVAASATRRVAIGDLQGDAAPLYALAGGEDAKGLAESFRDGIGLNEIARPVPDNASLFVLPAGDRVKNEPTLLSPDRWTRLISGFGEAGGLLVLIAPAESAVIPVLGAAGAGLVWNGPARRAPGGITLAATVGATRKRGRPWWRVGKGPEVGSAMVAGAILTATLGAGGASVLWIRARHAPTGTVTLPERRPPAPVDVAAGADTVAFMERLGTVDAGRRAPYAIEVMAANTATDANSWLHDHAGDTGLPAATIAVVAVRNGARGASKWHKVLVGAWYDAATADSAIATLRRKRIVAADGGVVVSAPYALLLADSASHERTRAVMDVWRAKGLVPYALTQDDGSVRVYAGAFGTVAQGATMAALVHNAGGTPIVAYRTGRPD